MIFFSESASVVDGSNDFVDCDACGLALLMTMALLVDFLVLTIKFADYFSFLISPVFSHARSFCAGIIGS